MENYIDLSNGGLVFDGHTLNQNLIIGIKMV
jgi:hypothetical protein